MNQKEIWGKYILAQQKVLENKSKPISINTINQPKIEGNKISISIDQEVFKKVLKADIERVFKLKNFDFSQNHILQDIAITEKISSDELSQLKENAQNNYIEFNEFPVIEGEIAAINNPREQLTEVIGVLPTNYSFKKEGLLLLTLDEKFACENIKGTDFEKTAGAVFQIKPSICYIISSFYKKIEIYELEKKIHIKGELNKSMLNVFYEHFRLKKTSHILHFEFHNHPTLNREIKNLDKKGIFFPEAKGNVVNFKYDNRFFEEHESDLFSEMVRLKRAFKVYFPNSDISITYSTQYSYETKMLNDGFLNLSRNEDVFWSRLFNEIHGNEYQISKSKRILSFDFDSQEELDKKLNHLNSLSFLDIYDREEKHKYKFRIKFTTGLHELQSILKNESPTLTTKLIGNGEKLIFRQFYKTGNKGFIRDNLLNKLGLLIDTGKFLLSISDTFQEKYICEENFDLKIEQEDEKLSKLRREEFYFGDKNDKFYLGTLQKVDYPILEFSIDDDKLHEVKENIALHGIKAIFPDLKGEKDKIVRLSNTISKLESKDVLPNNNAKHFLFDSSKAKKIENIEYLLNPDSPEWKEFENCVFSKQLNISQKQAVFKSLYSEELALIQGPPGTGKSTAIAEIIWQHVRRNQKEKILLTSETNLAVDNAIDKLKNDKHNVVKPIRFGNADKLESEGRFYSLNSIEDWKKNSDDIGNNTVAHWVNNISNRIIKNENETIDSALIRWKNILQTPSTRTRELFSDKYIKHANLIGATGSSIGKLNSEGKFTSFFRSYLSVYASNISHKDSKKVNICFDTIVMDEASKATPPELALPVLFGKKAIIVGDHRQLPPMVDGEEIKDTLISIGEKDLANTLSRNEFDKSQFQNLFEKIDSSIKGTFDTQYRMHPAINDVIAQFYVDDGGLKCGLPLEEKYHQSFDDKMSRYHGMKYDAILSPNTHVLWVNVDTPEIKEGTSRVNYGEVEAINNILKVIKSSDGTQEFNDWLSPQTEEEKQIGIISFYGKQLKHIERMIAENHKELPIRLSTVDRFQGMERNILVVSMVRSNTIATSKEQQPDFEIYGDFGYPLQNSLGFAESPNRLNVALSRARRLLVIVGNKDHFCSKEIYKNVYTTIISSETGKVVEAKELSKIINTNE